MLASNNINAEKKYLAKDRALSDEIKYLKESLQERDEEIRHLKESLLERDEEVAFKECKAALAHFNSLL